jgi:acetylornithine/succinyldiaminopimelate/putrescine aminotransferase
LALRDYSKQELDALLALLNVTHDTVLRFVPPLTVTKQEVNQMIGILETIFKEIV